MALYRFVDNDTSPSELPWPFAVEWSVDSSSSSKIQLLNTDGSYTVLYGNGFVLDGDGNPIAGNVDSIERLATDGSTVLERIDALNISLVDVDAAFESGTFIQTLLGGNDLVRGTDASDFDVPEVFFTGAGNDVVFGGGGTNVYVDGRGSDLYVGSSHASNADVIYDIMDYTASAFPIHLLLTGGPNSLGSHVTFVGSTDVDTLVNIDEVYGTEGDDIFTVTSSFVNKAGNGRAWIGPAGGHDVIHGNGQTVMDVATATDAVYVNLGLGIARSANGTPEQNLADIDVTFTGVRAVHGSVFDDILIGSDGPQSEEFMGSQGSDYIDGGGGAHDRDNIFAPSFGVIFDISSPVGFMKAVDPAFYHFGIDTIVNIEEVAATEHDDDITMSDVDNVAIGRNGNDVIRGLAGNDILVGDEGDGIYNSSPGNDILIGGLGKDTLTGDEGHDTFRFESIADSGKTAATRDVITDFAQGDDLIDLSAIDADPGLLGNQAFTWRGELAFNGHAGQLRFVRENAPGQANDHTIVEVDLNGDRSADFQIELTGLVKLTEHDFLL